MTSGSRRHRKCTQRSFRFVVRQMPRRRGSRQKGVTILATPPRLLEMHLAELPVSRCCSVSTLAAVREYLAQAPDADGRRRRGPDLIPGAVVCAHSSGRSQRHQRGREIHCDWLLYPRNRKTIPMTPQACTAGSRPLKRAGLPESIKLHELRHSAADDLYRETGDIVKAQKLLQEPVATTRGYLHPAREDLAEALASMSQQRSRRSRARPRGWPSSAACCFVSTNGGCARDSSEADSRTGRGFRRGPTVYQVSATRKRLLDYHVTTGANLRDCDKRGSYESNDSRIARAIHRGRINLARSGRTSDGAGRDAGSVGSCRLDLFP
jgi:hypothetical protein